VGPRQENFICLESDRKKEAWKFQRKVGFGLVTVPLFVFPQLAHVSKAGSQRRCVKRFFHHSRTLSLIPSRLRTATHDPAQQEPPAGSPAPSAPRPKPTALFSLQAGEKDYKRGALFASPRHFNTSEVKYNMKINGFNLILISFQEGYHWCFPS